MTGSSEIFRWLSPVFHNQGWETRFLRHTAWLSLYCFIAVLGLFSYSIRAAEAQEEKLWIRTGGGAGADQGGAISVDQFGNTYQTGFFSGAAKWGDIELAGSGAQDVFLTKYNTAGVSLWARRFGGPQSDIGRAIVSDTNSCVYLVGVFGGTASFGTTNLVSAGGSDIFLVKCDASGNVLWARNAGSTENDRADAVAVDQNGNVFLTGTIQGRARFAGIVLESAGGEDVFIAKYSSSGDVLWVKRGGGTAADQGISIAIDSEGNCIVAGEFSGTATFENKTLSSNGGVDIFLLKYDTNGGLLWGSSYGGALDQSVNKIVLDATGNCYFAGSMAGTLRFGTNSVSSLGQMDALVMKCDSAGSLLWASAGGGVGLDDAAGLAVDDTGHCYVIGYFSDTAMFRSLRVVSGGRSDIFLAKYNPSGVPQWVKSANGTAQDYGTDIDLDASGKIYFSGHFGFATGAGIRMDGVVVTSSGSGDAFLARRLELLPVINEQPKDQAVVVGSNAVFSVTARSDSPVSYFWRKAGVFIAGQTNSSLALQNAQLSDAGFYSVILSNLDGTITSASARLKVNYSLNISVQGRGSVTRQPEEPNYEPGSVVNLTAVPNDGQVFLGWSGEIVGTSNPASLIMDTNKSVTALFDLPRLVINHEGEGLVTKTPDKASYSLGESVTLKATPARWFVFSKWSDGSQENPRVVTIGPQNNLIAVFTPTVPLEFVEVDGVSRLAPIGTPIVLVDGKLIVSNRISIGGPVEVEIGTSFTNGSVRIALDSDSGVGAFAPYQGVFTIASNVTLRAIAYSGDFLQSAESDPIHFTRTVAFSLNTITNGGGEIIATPAAGAYASNSVVSLHAVADPGWTFLNWDGAVLVNTNLFNLVMDGDKEIKAVFVTSLTINAAGQGSVISNPGGALYPYGTRVRLTAVPKSGYYFDFWGGGAQGSDNPLELTVTNTNPIVGALFVPLAGNQVALTLIEKGEGKVTRTPASNVYTNGQQVTLLAVPAAGQQFLGWGDGLGAANPLTFTLQGSQTIHANFSQSGNLAISKELQTPDSEFSLFANGKTGGHFFLQSSDNLGVWTNLFYLQSRIRSLRIPQGDAELPQKYFRIVPALEE